MVQARLAVPGMCWTDGPSRVSRDGDPGLLPDLEPGLADGRTGVAAAGAAAGQAWVERGVREPFQPGERRLVRDHVLEVPELTGGAQHAADSR